MKSRAAQALGRLAKGVSKTLTRAQRRQRREQLAAARAKRWPVQTSKHESK
jgi:hypothetical protein